MYPQSQPIEPERSWMGRHLAAVISIAAVAALVAFLAAILYWVFTIMGNSDPARLAFDTASASPVVIGRLGTPLKKGLLVSGRIEVTGPAGSAEISIPISGPRGEGALYVSARKTAGLWQLDLLQFGPKDSEERFDLLQKKVPPLTSQ